MDTVFLLVKNQADMSYILVNMQQLLQVSEHNIANILKVSHILEVMRNEKNICQSSTKIIVYRQQGPFQPFIACDYRTQSASFLEKCLKTCLFFLIFAYILPKFSPDSLRTNYFLTIIFTQNLKENFVASYILKTSQQQWT